MKKTATIIGLVVGLPAAVLLAIFGRQRLQKRRVAGDADGATVCPLPATPQEREAVEGWSNEGGAPPPKGCD